MNDFTSCLAGFIAAALVLWVTARLSFLHGEKKEKAAWTEHLENEIARKRKFEIMAQESLFVTRQRDAENRQTDAIEALIAHAQKLETEVAFNVSRFECLQVHVLKYSDKVDALETKVERDLPGHAYSRLLELDSRIKFCEERLAGKAAP